MNEAKARIRKRMDDHVAQHGSWKAHNIHLGEGIYTINDSVTTRERRLARILQTISDVTQKSFDELRILDLACAEGMNAIECARQGSQVVGIEGRLSSLNKAIFVKELLTLDNLQVLQDDVRNLCPKHYGCFDVVLSLGILYHLDAPDVFHFIENMYNVCKHLLIIDTEISMHPRTSVQYNGSTYWGQLYEEHDELDSAEVKEQRFLASLDNPKSFWLTRASLINALYRTNFTSVYENLILPERRLDRINVIALKGHGLLPSASPQRVHLDEKLSGDWPEHRQTDLHPINQIS